MIFAAIPVIAAIVAIAAVVYVAINAPDGSEDSTGFHGGETS
jgi:hypothetical protein